MGRYRCGVRPTGFTAFQFSAHQIH